MERATISAVILLFGLFLIGCGTTATKEKATINSCDTFPQCLELLESIKVSEYYGLSDDEQEFAQSFTRFGEPALEALLQRLDIGNNRGKIVGYAIASFDPIDEKYLPQIVEGVKSDVSWLARALGNIPTEKGAEAAVDAYLVSSSAPHNQEAHAVRKQGKRAVPFILQRMQCGEYCKGVNREALVHLIEDMDPASKNFMALELIKQLNASDISSADQANLLALFTNMGPSGLVAESELEMFATKFPKLSPQIDQAYIGIHSSHSGRVFADWVKVNPDNFWLLSDIADLGPAARDAGSAVLSQLASESIEVKINAVRTLGLIEYAPAEQSLLPLAEDAKNVPLSIMAVNALGRIGSPESLPALQNVKEEYWHPSVRKEAELALEAIASRYLEGGDRDINVREPGVYPFFRLDLQSCKDVRLNAVTIDSSLKLFGYDNPALEKLQYVSYVTGYRAGDEEEQKAKDPGGVVEVNQRNMVEVRTETTKTPTVAYRTEYGWLTGSDGGEWGGELMFLPDEGELNELQTGKNVRDLYKFNDFYISITGVAHLGINEGQIFQIRKEGSNWKVEQWVTLPGAPKRSWLVDTGEIAIDTYKGGTILLASDGTLRMAPCDEYEEN